MKQIWKFPLQVVDRQEIILPMGAQPLTVQVQMQNGVPCVCLWAMVNPNAPRTEMPIRVIDTGHAIPDPDKLVYISTFQMYEGGLVFHVFKEL